MLNTRLFNIHDIIVIMSVVVITHVLVRPMLDRIGLLVADNESPNASMTAA